MKNMNYWCNIVMWISCAVVSMYMLHLGMGVDGSAIMAIPMIVTLFTAFWKNMK